MAIIIGSFSPISTPDKAIARNIEWPDEEDEFDAVAKDLIEGLLQQDPLDRFDVEQVKKHPFFGDIDFHTLLRQVIYASALYSTD